MTAATARLSRAVRDVRALGSGAPLRLALELSKRVGLHGAVFGRLARASTATPELVLPFESPPIDVTDAARQRTLVAAATIAAGTIEIFGQPLDLGTDPDWHAAIDGPERWPLLPWWQIDIRSSARLGDVKWVWELGRHRHLVILARAAALEPDGPWTRLLEQQLTSWLDANPPEVGIHWYSNLEIALRAISWVQILDGAGPHLSTAVTARMHETLYRSGSHLLADVPYTLSTMRNNHLVGDALGLCVLGRCFPGDARAQRWRSIGDRLFERQLRTQVHDDGSMVEDSVSYHHFVLEMLAVRVMLGDASNDTHLALARSAALLVRLGALHGEVPRYGDGDEGRVLVSTGPGDDLTGSVHLAFDLTGAAAEGGHERERADAVAEVRGNPIGGGLARAVVGPFTVWLKAGGDWSHGHADLCSTWIRLDDEWIMGDPGTGTYNGPVEQRDYFRTSIAHPVLRLDGLDQLEPYRAFRWVHPAVGAVGEPVVLDGATDTGPDGAIDPAVVMWGWHGSYQRLDPPRRVVRVVVVETDAVTSIDWVEGPPGIPYALSLPLTPHATFADGVLCLASRRTVSLRVIGGERSTLTQRGGQADPFDGWWSPTYGSMEPSVRLEATGVVAGPIAWQVGRADDAGSTAATGVSSIAMQGETVLVGGRSVRVAFEADGVVLTCRDATLEQQRRMPT